MSDDTKVTRDYIDAFSFKQDAIDTIMPKYFGDDTSDLNVGLKGYTTELVGHVAEDSFNAISTLFVEQFPNRAQIPESIYSHAAIFQLSDTFATAAECKFLLILVEDEILKYAKEEPDTVDQSKGNVVIHIGGNTQISVEDKIFTIDYPIEIQGRWFKNTYVYTADYVIDTDAKNSISSINSPHIRIRKTNIGYIGLEVTAHQVVKTEQEETIINNTSINYPIINVKHDDQLAGMDVFYKAPKDTDWTLLEKRIIYSTPVKTPFCYYSKVDSDQVDIHFSSRDFFFQPEFNSKIKVVIYSTEGSEGNFETYTGDNIAVISDNETYSYNSNMTMVAMVMSSSQGGLDVISIDDLQALTVEAYSSATEISTDYDLERYYYNFKHRYNNEILVLKRRDDASERLFSAFLLMKANNYIYKTNTIKMQCSESMFETTLYERGAPYQSTGELVTDKLLLKSLDGSNNTSNTFMIKPGSLFKYDKNDTERVVLMTGANDNIYSLKDNDIYDQEYYFCTGKNYLLPNDYGMYDYYNGKRDTKIIKNLSKDKINFLIGCGIFKQYSDKYYDTTDLYWKINSKGKYDLNHVSGSITYSNIITDVDYSTIIDFYEDGCVKKDTILDYNFVYTNPFLIIFTKKPNNVAYYLTMCNESYPLDFTYAISDAAVPNFIMSQLRVRRDMYPKNIYTVYTTVACSLASVSDNVESTFNTEESLFTTVGNVSTIDDRNNRDYVSNNNLRVIATFAVNGKESCFIELFPLNYTDADESTAVELAGPNITFVGHLFTDDMIIDDNRFRVLNTTVTTMNLTTEYAYIPTEDCIVTVYTLYKKEGAVNKFADFESTLEGYEITDIYKTNSEPATFIKPMNLMRSTMTMSVDDTDDCVFDIALVPLVKHTLLNNEDEFDTFLTTLVDQYNYLEESMDILRNNTGIDIKFYNTYGRSKNLFIGDDEELIDMVNISITFDVTAVYGTNTDVLLTNLKTFIKEYIEQINTAGRNHIYVSNLMREIENNFSEVHHLKFISINNYDSTYQSVFNKVVDINDLPKEERRDYVPEILVIEDDTINISMYVDNTGVDEDSVS